MFQQGGKIYLNTSNWKRYHRLNTNNISNNNNYNSNKINNKDKPDDIDDNLTPKLSKFSCSLQPLNRFKTRIINSQKTGLRKVNSIYSVSSVKERLANEAGTNTGIDIYRIKQKMANTLSVMTNVLRNVVSKQRIRYKEKGFNLDLAYICDNIIAMGYPADNYESMYRNPLGDVYKFLEDNHHDHYKIYNLCLERSYDITKFHGRVSVYPFEDHNPPTIELILKFCEDMDSWLKAHALNVAAVHCKAGKGRTGTMICCYLVFCGLYPTADEALACYDEKRTKDRKGVTIPSQRRYVQYFSTLMRLGLPYERRTLQFCEIRFAKANTLHNQGTVHCSISVLQDKVQQLQNFPIDFRKHNILDMKNPSLPVAGDIKVELTKNTKKIFHFWFNTFFVTDSSVIEGEGSDVKFVYTLQKWEIDEVHKDKCYPEDFKVELVFYIDDNNVDRDHLRVSASNRVTSNNRNTKQNDGTIRMSLQHQHHQQSNNYSLPQNNSSGSEINLTCDQKSSSSISVSSSLGVGGTDTSNGYESNRSTTRSVAPSLSNHCGNHYMMSKDVNNGMVYSASPSAQHMAVPPPSYLENNLTHYKQNQLQQQQQQQQQHQNNTAIVATTANQRHFQRKVTVGCSGDTIGGDDADAHAFHANNTDVNTVNANKCSSIGSSSNNSTNNGSNSYNHNQHHSNSNNSSKTSSVSSQSSSSAIGDNEEDWESANSTTTQQIQVDDGTKMYIFNNISSVDVIKQNNKLNNISGFISNATTIITAAAIAEVAETKYNQQQIKKNMKQYYPQQLQQPQNLCNGLINNESRISTTTTTTTTIATTCQTRNNLINTISNLNTNTNNTTTNNTNTNVTTATTTTTTANSKSQQFCHSYLQTGDLSSELKCC